MKRIIAALAAALLTTAGAGAASANPFGSSDPNTNPPSIGSGARYNVREMPAICNIAAVGIDNAGRKIALTAGHCANRGYTVITMRGVPLGTVAVSKPPLDDATSLDYDVIVLNRNVVLRDDPSTPSHITTIAAPQVGGPVSEYGTFFGLWHMYEHGTTTHVNPGTFFTTPRLAPGMSGGPVWSGTALEGWVSRTDWGRNVQIRADAVIAELTAKGLPGAGFTPSE